jgi:signal transduction histidine kinase
LTWDVFGTAFFWMFINVMVGVGLVSLAAYPPLWLTRFVAARGGYLRDVAAASVMAVFCMFATWEPGPGLKMDIRMVPLGLVGWTHGPSAAAIVGAAIIAVRTVMGGADAGIVATIFYTLLCVAMIPLFRGRPKTWPWLAAMGVAQTMAGYAVGQVVHARQPPGLELTSPLWLGLAVIQVISLWVINWQVCSLQEKQRLQAELSSALESKEAMLQLIPHALFILDKDRRVVEANEAASRLASAGGLPAEVLANAEVADALRHHRRISGSRTTVTDDRGCERIMLVSMVPLENGSMMLGMANVTTLVRQEREEARRDRLELLGRMAAMAAHEIKNPLTTIKGFLQLMLGRPEFAAHRPTFSLVQGEVEHINRVVGDFLDLSRGADQQPEKVELDGLLREVVAGMELQFPGNGVEVRFEGEDGLAAVVDRKSLKQILRNLVANAYEAMPGGGLLRFRRAFVVQGISLSVIDSGPGIGPDVMAHIFTPYTTTKSTGTGLGLAISHKLATELGAELTVESEVGHGSCFRLWLPVSVGPVVQAAAGEMPPS